MHTLIQFLLMTVLPYLAVLTLVITVHEFGHFGMARLFGVAVDRFSIGFGKALVSWKDKSGIEWRIGAIPLGGYVRFCGDEEASSAAPAAEDLQALRREIAAREGVGALGRYFHFKPLWQRALVILAGPLANFLLSIAIFAALALLFGSTVLTPRIGTVSPDGPAAAAGFRPGDLITRLNGARVDDFRAVADFVRLRTGEAIHVTVQRGGAEQTIDVTPVRHPLNDPLTGHTSQLGYLGLSPAAAPGDIYRRQYNPVQAVGYGVQTTWDLLSTTVFYLGRMVTGHESPTQLRSIIGIAQTSGAVTKAAVNSTPDLGGRVVNLTVSLLGLAGFISVSIGFMNLLPIPVLDGGHLAFYAYEAVARRPAAAKVQAMGYRVGLALLLGLMLFATWNDFRQIPVLKILGGLFS